MLGSFTTTYLCLCLSVPLPSILYLANSYSSFKTQLPCVLLCPFPHSPPGHYFILWASITFCPHPCGNVGWLHWKMHVFVNTLLHFLSFPTICAFIHLFMHPSSAS
ncbi:unnamed protein product [Gulo gulo]|uniref:Uncharacterized protein n=1 Tax=Gulo gulo TaxID=48420 RepID=A0A9X9Q5V2_GULGU|nr:unnamed protein product [Gulo gulo]